MAVDKFPKSGLPIRRSVELLPVIFQTPANDKFLSAVVDPLIPVSYTHLTLPTSDLV